MENIKFTQEKNESNEQVTSKVELHFFRHSIKEKQNIYDKGDDNLVPLSKEGKKLAQEQGEANIEQSISFGSPRIRSQETALYKMAGGMETIDGAENLEELIEKVDAEVTLGSKLAIDKRLDFNLSKELENEYSKKIYEEYSNGNYFNFLINESNQFAEQVKDNESLTYQRGVEQIGSILKKYLKISDRWNEILNKDEEGKYTSDTLKRFMGSHQGVTECFLAKVIQKRLGEEKLQEFVGILDNKGFDFTEGYKIDINNLSNGERKILVSYEKELENGKKYEVSEIFSELEIDKIISE